MRTGLTIFALLLPLAACSHGVSNPGQGSSTLTVDANVRSQSNAVNTTSTAAYDTEFSVQVTKAGAALSGAMVEIDSDLGKVILTERQGGQGNGGINYTGQQTGYARTYTLNVHLGADFLENVALSGPDAHSFSAPLLGAQAISGQPLEVKWSPSGATSATIDTSALDRTAIPDTGSYTVPPGGLKSVDPGKTNDDHVRVNRTETLVPNGALTGSSLSVSVSNEITFLVVGM